MSDHYEFVILGGGNSAGYAAREFVARGGGAGHLAIITDEPYVSYERPALSKAYLAPESPARLPGFHACVGGGGDRQLPDWYAEHGIDYLTDTHIINADILCKRLSSSSGKQITYDKLIIATGARPVNLSDFKTPGAEMRGIHYLRNVKDADALIAAIAKTKESGGKAVCIGGGYIGMECAAALANNGLQVTMVFPESRLMERFFTPEIAGFYEKFYEGKGITMVKGALASGFRGDESGAVTHTILKDGRELESSLVIVGVGARPNVELFKGQLELVEGPPGGIKVDTSLETSTSGVWAVGDVAAFPQSREQGTLTRQEHVAHCRASAAHAVAAMMGAAPGPYEYLPFFYSRVFSLSWQFYGSARGEVVHFGDFEAGKFGAYWVDGDRVVGAFLEGGSPEEFAAIKRVAQVQPAAPPAEELAAQGVEYGSKL